jgi:NTE family protein
MNRTLTSEGTAGRSNFLALGIGLALLITMVPPRIAIAQEASQAHKRPTVGVALEGGGALGLAHIGVLRWFEQHHIPIDYLSGNSMGALVGGLYATGKSPDDLERLVKQMDWPLALAGETPYEDLSYRRKEDARAAQNDLAIGFKHGPTLPSGLSAGHQINLVIDRETLAYSSVKSFDDLPIPFRCVSTELISGKAHVFSTGPIGFAMRSSMSLPAVFAPVRDGDRVYVDGALVDNLPTDLARDMGPDVVIAIHLQVAPATADEIQSLFSVLGQAITVGTAKTEMRGMEAADIVVKVDVQKFTSLEFDKADALIQQGMQAAEEKAKVLQPYALDQAAWDEYVARRDARKQNAVGIPQFVRVEGTSEDGNQKIQKFLQPLVGKPIDTPRLETYLTRLTGMGRFESTTYALTETDGKVGLLVAVHEKNNAPPVLQLAFDVNGTQPDDVTFAMGGRLTFLDVGGFGSELRIDFEIGHVYGIDTELYKRFSETSRWFFAPRANASSSASWIYSDGDPKADYRIGRAGAGMDLGYALSRFSEVRTGYEIGYLNARLKLGTPEFSSVDGRVGASRFRLTTDHLNDPVIPRRGYLGQLTFHWVDTSPGATEAYPSLELTTEFFHPVSRPSSVFLVARGGSTLGYERTGIPQYFLGSTAGLLAYGQNEVRGNQFYLFRAGYLHRLANLPPFLGGGVYAVGLYEVGKMYNAPGVSKLPNDGAAGMIMRTALGPIFVGGSVGDTGHATWFFSLGRVF